MECKLHTCKICKYQRRLKIIDQCSDCFHNELFKPLSGIGKCCWEEKINANTNKSDNWNRSK